MPEAIVALPDLLLEVCETPTGKVLQRVLGRS